MSFGEIVIWLIVGAMSGSLAGMLVTGSKEGFGRTKNLALGMIGAVVGGFVFESFNIDFGLGQISVSFEDLIAAFMGAITFLLILRAIQMFRDQQAAS